MTTPHLTKSTIAAIVACTGLSMIASAGAITADEYTIKAAQAFKEGKRSEALADFDKAIELSPKPAHYRNRAAFFVATKQGDKAAADYDKVLSMEKNDLTSLANRGYAYGEGGHPDNAIADFDADRERA